MKFSSNRARLSLNFGKTSDLFYQVVEVLSHKSLINGFSKTISTRQFSSVRILAFAVGRDLGKARKKWTILVVKNSLTAVSGVKVRINVNTTTTCHQIKQCLRRKVSLTMEITSTATHSTTALFHRIIMKTIVSKCNVIKITLIKMHRRCSQQVNSVSREPVQVLAILVPDISLIPRKLIRHARVHSPGIMHNATATTARRLVNSWTWLTWKILCESRNSQKSHASKELSIPLPLLISYQTIK